jgi:hypothetical protein
MQEYGKSNRMDCEFLNKKVSSSVLAAWLDAFPAALCHCPRRAFPLSAKQGARSGAAGIPTD